MYKLTTTAAFAVLGGALLAAEQASALPVVPSPSKVPVPGALVKADPEVEKLRKDLDEANKKIADLEKQLKLERQLKRLADLLDGMKDEGGQLVNPKAPGAIEEIKRLNDTIVRLQEELKTLKSQTSLRPTVGPEARATGTVKIINEYPVEVSIVVNDKSYRVGANKVLDVEIPAGEFTYQLLQSGAAATRSVIREKETVRLRIK